MKKLVAVAGLALLAGCSENTDKIKAAISVKTYPGAITYCINENPISKLSKDLNSWVYNNNRIFNGEFDRFIGINDAGADIPDIAIVPDVSLSSGKMKYDFYIFIDQKMKDNVKSFACSYGDCLPIRTGNDPQKKYFKDKTIGSNEFSKINERLYAYHLSWKAEIKDSDEQALVITTPQGNKTIFSTISSKELANILK